jgi:hypothetical protein
LPFGSVKLFSRGLHQIGDRFVHLISFSSAVASASRPCTGAAMNERIPGQNADSAAALYSKVDLRLCFLERATARLILFESGLMSLDEAVFGLLGDYCPCSTERKPA